MDQQSINPESLPWGSMQLGEFFHLPKASIARIEVRNLIKQEQASNPGRRYYLESMPGQWRIYRIR